MNQVQKWVNLSLLVGTFCLFAFLAKMTGWLWELVQFPRFEGLPVSMDTLAALGVSVAAGVVTRRSQRANQFLNEVVVELGKVTWPPRKETVASSGVVIVLVGIATVIMTVVDVIWAKMARGVLF